MHIERRRAQESRERELQDEWEANRKLDETCQTEDSLWVSEEQNHRSRIIEDRAEKIRFEKDQTQKDKKDKAAAKEKLKVEKQEAKNRKLKRIEEKERHYRGYIGKEQLGQESQRAKARETQLQPKNPVCSFFVLTLSLVCTAALLAMCKINLTHLLALDRD